MTFGAKLGDYSIYVLLFFRQTFRGTPYSRLIICLAIFDTLRLWSGLPIQWSKFLFGFHPANLHLVICKLHYYIATVANCTSAWILVIITTFRAISIWKPHKAKIICTSKRAILLVIISFMIHVISFLHIPLKWHIWGMVRQRGVITLGCQKPDENLSDLEHDVMRWFMLIAASLFPFLGLIFGNTYIIIKVTLAKFKRQNSNTRNSIHRQNQRDHSMTLSLITITVLFLITTFPFLFLKLFEFRGITLLAGETAISLAKYKVWRSVALIFNYVNNVANIFCYWISGSLFRKELKALLCNKK